VAVDYYDSLQAGPLPAPLSWIAECRERRSRPPMIMASVPSTLRNILHGPQRAVAWTEECVAPERCALLDSKGGEAGRSPVPE